MAISYFEKWRNDRSALFDMTDRDHPVFIQFVTVDSVSIKKGDRATVVLSAPMPDEWLWNFRADTLEVLQIPCSDKRGYAQSRRIIELSNCQELFRWIDDLMVARDDDIGITVLKMRIICDVKVIFESDVQ